MVTVQRGLSALTISKALFFTTKNTKNTKLKKRLQLKSVLVFFVAVLRGKNGRDDRLLIGGLNGYEL